MQVPLSRTQSAHTPPSKTHRPLTHLCPGRQHVVTTLPLEVVVETWHVFGQQTPLMQLSSFVQHVWGAVGVVGPQTLSFLQHLLPARI